MRTPRPLAWCGPTVAVTAAALLGGSGASAKAASAPIALARRLVHSLAAAPPAARLALPVEHQALAAAAGAFLCAAGAIELSARWRDTRRRGHGRAARRLGRSTAPSLDVASAAGTRTLALDRARARAVDDGEGRLLAQVVWSHDLGWCAQASWPHFLYGPEGLPRTTAPLPDGVWLHVAGVGLRLRTGVTRPSSPERAAGRASQRAL